MLKLNELPCTFVLEIALSQAAKITHLSTSDLALRIIDSWDSLFTLVATVGYSSHGSPCLRDTSRLF